MFIWRLRSIKLHNPTDCSNAIAESIHYALVGHDVGQYNPDMFFQDKVRSERASLMQSPQLDIDPDKPIEQERERIQRFKDQFTLKSQDYVLVLEVEAGIPKEEYEAIKTQLGVDTPAYQTTPQTEEGVPKVFNNEIELRNAIEKHEPEPGETFSPEEQEDFREFNAMADRLREYICDHPPFPEFGQPLVGTAKRETWLREIVAPWIIKGYDKDTGRLPFGVERIREGPTYEDICQRCAVENLKHRGPKSLTHKFGSKDFEHAYVAPQKGDAIPLNTPPHSIWIVGWGIYQLPYRRKGKLIAAFSGDLRRPRGFQGKTSSSELPGQLTARARQEVESEIFDFVTGVYKGSQNNKEELITFIKKELGIEPGTKLHDLVFGPYDRNVAVHEFPGSKQGEEFTYPGRQGAKYHNVVIGVTIKLGDSSIVNKAHPPQRGFRAADKSVTYQLPLQRQPYLFGYLARASANPDNWERLWEGRKGGSLQKKLERQPKRPTSTPSPSKAGITDIFVLNTGLEGLGKIYGALNKPGTHIRQSFGPTKKSFEEIIGMDIIGIQPGAGTCRSCDGTGRLSYEYRKQKSASPGGYKPGREPGSICYSCNGTGTISPSAVRYGDSERFKPDPEKGHYEGDVVRNERTGQVVDKGPFYGVKGAFKEIRVRNDGQIWLIFAKPELADPILIDPEVRKTPTGVERTGTFKCAPCSQAEGVNVYHKDDEAEFDAHYDATFGREERFGLGRRSSPQFRPKINPIAMQRGEEPIEGFIAPQPASLPRTPENIEKYNRWKAEHAQKEAQKEKELHIDEPGPEFKTCSRCTGSGHIWKPVPTEETNAEGEVVKTVDYKDEPCPDCTPPGKDEGVGQLRLRPTIDKSKVGLKKAAKLKAVRLYADPIIKNDPLTIGMIVNLSRIAEKHGLIIDPDERTKLMIRMAQYIRARNAKLDYDLRKAKGLITKKEEEEGELTTEMPFYLKDAQGDYKRDERGNKIPNPALAYWYDLDQKFGYYAPPEEQFTATNLDELFPTSG